MGFTPEQKDALAKPLSLANVKTRSQSNVKYSYIEGWKVIEEANRIFGFDGWTREVADLRLVSEFERSIGSGNKKGWGVSYIARVVLTVHGIVREGIGAGHGINMDRGQAHEGAAKEAETDAMKRAFITFGYPFGLALYDKEQEHVDDGAPAQAPSALPNQLLREPDATKRQDELIAEISDIDSLDRLNLFIRSAAFKSNIAQLPERHRGSVRLAYLNRAELLKEPIE